MITASENTKIAEEVTYNHVSMIFIHDEETQRIKLASGLSKICAYKFSIGSKPLEVEKFKEYFLHLL